jgi:hypothetical protein
VAAAEQEEAVWAELDLLDDDAFEAKMLVTWREGVLADMAELDSRELDSLEAEVRAAEREVLAAEAAAAADTATQMYSDLFGVTGEAAEMALWGGNAIPEGEREPNSEMCIAALSAKSDILTPLKSES